MNKSNLLKLLIVSITLLTFSCRNIEEDVTVVQNNTSSTTNENTTLVGRITENRTLKAQYTYELSGMVYVTNGAVLTIEPGTKIVGKTGKAGALIITRNAKIIAEGTASNPIIFTSQSATPQRGDWAGLVLLGNAPTNASFNGVQGIGEIEGGINNSEGLGLYGGTNTADNSGVLKYVRIEYAGYAFLPDKEINGLTLGGVGNGTLIDYVQVSFSNDDSFEWFGGTVNCKHLIAFHGLDDDFDTDNGFSGKVQFAIGVRDPQIADISKSNAFESDNDANGSTLTPFTSAVFSNVTIVGPIKNTGDAINSLYGSAIHLRRNSSQSIFNSVFLGYPTSLLIDGSKGNPTDLNVNSTNLLFQNNIIAGSINPISYAGSTNSPTGASISSITAWFNTASNNNALLTNSFDATLLGAFNYSSPNYQPTIGSLLLTGASFTHTKLSSGFTPVNYRGAIGSGETWYTGWTKFK